MASNTTTTRTHGDVHESVASGREPNTILLSPTQPESPALVAAVPAEASQATPEASQTATLPRLAGKKRKEMAPRSYVWGHFEKILQNGVLKAECKHCKSIFAYSSGTSSLSSHLKICKALHKLDSTQTELVLNSGEVGGIAVWKLDQAAARKALARMIVVDELPFKFVQKEGFVDYSSTISPKFRIPSRFTIAKDIFQLYEQERSCLKDSLLDNGQRICVTTDTWTSNQNMSYMSLTAHYIDDKWRLNKKVLSFCPITSHTGEGIGKAVEDCLIQWGIEKVFTVTVDNASANDVALDYLKRKIKNWGNSVLECKWLHMRCMAHIINLVVVDGLKQQEAQDALKNVRHVVKHVKKSPQRLARFKKCAERAKIQSKALLCLDVSTRWNSTYLMLHAAEKYETAFETYVDNDRDLQNELLELGCGFLDAEDWATVRRVLIFLEKFYIMTVRISGSTYVTSNMFFDEIVQLHDWLAEWGRSKDTLFLSMAARMNQKYEKYWGDFKKMNVIIYIGCILDPRWKWKYVEVVIADLYQSNVEMANQMCNHISEALNEMYKWYEKLKNVDSNVDSEVSSLVTPSPSTSSSMNDRHKKYYSLITTDENLTDLERYLKEDPPKGELNVLGWWKVNAGRFPILSEMAHDVLAVPVSTVASESTFSAGGRVLNYFRSSLSPKMVEQLICCQSWLRKLPLIEDEEDEEAIIELEKGMDKCSINTTTLSDDMEH